MSDGWGDASGIEGNYEDTDSAENTNETSETNDTSERAETAETNVSTGTSETNSPTEANETNDVSETGETSETNETTEAPGLNGTTETKETAGTNKTKTNIKDQWNGRTIYIPDDILDNLEDTYLESQLKLRRTGQDEFKKNRHFYPLLVQFGLEALADAEVEEIQARLSDIHDE